MGHQLSHVTFDLQFVLPRRYAGVKVVKKLWEWQTNDMGPVWDPCYESDPTPDTAGSRDWVA